MVNSAEVTRAYSNFVVPSMTKDVAQGGSDALLTDQASGFGPLLISADERPESPPWRVSEDQERIVTQVFDEGGSVGDAARRAGVAWSTARKLLTSEIIRSGRQMPMWPAMTETMVKEAVLLRADGWGYGRIAAKLGVSKPTASKHLKRLGY